MRQIGVYAFYEHGHPIATFPSIHGITEQPILTTGRTFDDVAGELMRRTGLL